MAPALELIAFDGDDTLWHNERSYRDGRDRLRGLLAAAGVDLSAEQLEERVDRIELENLQYFGYGVSSFTLSLIEAAIELTSGRIAAPRMSSCSPARAIPSQRFRLPIR